MPGPSTLRCEAPLRNLFNIGLFNPYINNVIPYTQQVAYWAITSLPTSLS